MSDSVRLAIQPDRKAQSAAALQAFLCVAAVWKLSITDQITLLGISARSTFFQWKRAPNVCLPRDTLERISYLLGIHEALQRLLSDPAAADTWIRQPSQAPLFSGRSVLQRMLAGQVADLYEVRRHLEAQRAQFG